MGIELFFCYYLVSFVTIGTSLLVIPGTKNVRQMTENLDIPIMHCIDERQDFFELQRSQVAYSQLCCQLFLRRNLKMITCLDQ